MAYLHSKHCVDMMEWCGMEMVERSGGGGIDE